MEQNLLVRIEKDSKRKGLLRFSVLGLNILAANTTQNDSVPLTLQDDPVLKFLGALTLGYEAICLLGSPAPDNWRNQEQREGRTHRIEDLLGKDMSYSEVPVSYYGGSFRAEQNYGPSLIFGLRNQELLEKLCDPFLWWDALAFIMYRKGKDALRMARSALRTFTTETALIEALLQEARCLVLTQGDCQYLEVYTKSSDLMDELETAGAEADTHIKKTEWYQEHKDMLVWDDTEACYVISK